MRAKYGQIVHGSFPPDAWGHVMPTPTELRKQAKALEDQAWEMDRAEIRSHERFMVGENIQDEGRPRVSGPFTWDEAAKAVRDHPNRFICDYVSLLP